MLELSLLRRVYQPARQRTSRPRRFYMTLARSITSLGHSCKRKVNSVPKRRRFCSHILFAALNSSPQFLIFAEESSSRYATTTRTTTELGILTVCEVKTFRLDPG